MICVQAAILAIMYWKYAIPRFETILYVRLSSLTQTDAVRLESLTYKNETCQMNRPGLPAGGPPGRAHQRGPALRVGARLQLDLRHCARVARAVGPRPQRLARRRHHCRAEHGRRGQLCQSAIAADRQHFRDARQNAGSAREPR